MLLADFVLNTIDHEHAMTGIMLALYTGVAIFWTQKVLYRKRNHRRADTQESFNKENDEQNDKNPNTTRTIRTLQYVACAITVYILAPIAFAHASLAYLPSILWSPILAFLDYASMKNSVRGNNIVKKYVVIPTLSMLVFVTAPPVSLIPNIFSTYTTFVRFAYVPIHTLFFLLVTSIIVS